MPDPDLRQGLSVWGLAQAAALAALLAGVYATSHTYMVSMWDSDDYSYCYLIPAVIGYILWGKRRRLLELGAQGGWAGTAFLLLGAALFALGEFGSEYYSQFLSSWFVALGLCWLFFGRRVVAESGFVFLLLFTMMPLPGFLNTKVSVQLQLMATQMGEAMIRMLGMSVYREGNIIDLGFMQLQVVDACSGLRYLFPLVVLGLVLAYFSRLGLWKKCVLVAASIPISLVLNALRIAVTALASKHLGPEVAEGFSHDFAGWAIFLVSFGLLYAVSLGLGALPGENAPPPAPPAPDPAQPPSEAAAESPAGAAPAEAAPTQAAPAPPAGLAMGRLPGPRFFVAAAILAAMLFGVAGQGGREQPPASRPFAEFPMQIGPWSGAPQYLERDILNTLRLSEYVMADYRAGEGASVNLYVAFYKSQRKGQAIHSPETCLPGTGWSVEEASVVPALPGEAAGGKVNRSLASKGPSRVLTYFWFQQHGKKLTTLPELKLSTFMGAVTLRRTDGALVRLSTNLGQHEPATQGDERLRRFLRDVEPTLRQFVPD